MTPNDLKTEIPIEKKEMIHTFRQTIRPVAQTGVPGLMETLWDSLRKGRFTGNVTVHMNQGGVRDIVTEQKVPE